MTDCRLDKITGEFARLNFCGEDMCPYCGSKNVQAINQVRKGISFSNAGGFSQCDRPIFRGQVCPDCGKRYVLEFGLRNVFTAESVIAAFSDLVKLF